MKKCIKCQGYGWYPIGFLSPIGRGDSYEWGKRVIKCPWCKKGFVDEGERYDALKRVYDKEEGENEK